MTKSTEEILRELESGGILSGSAPPAQPPARRPTGKIRAPSQTNESFGLIFLVIAALLIGVVGSLPFGNYALYPFSLFVTLVHESCHAISAVVSGGSVQSLQVSSDLSGVTTIGGGWQVLISPAGYLGASFVGAALLVTPLRYARWAIGALAAFPLAALFFFHPASFFTTAWCVAFAAVLAGMAWRLPARLISFLQIFLGVACGLNAFRDLMTLFFISTSQSGIHTDATNMSDIIPLPATVWAVIWTIMSLVILGGALVVMVNKHVRQIRPVSLRGT